MKYKGKTLKIKRQRQEKLFRNAFYAKLFEARLNSNLGSIQPIKVMNV
jgi:hypothetical protein